MKLIFALFIFIFACMPLEAKSGQCLAKSKEHFNEKEYSQAEKTLIKCLKEDPKNSDALISLAGVEMILGKFNYAEANFKRALAVLEPNSPYKAYIYSRMGDIYMRRTDLKEAEKYYNAALKYEPANINALVGAGICQEKNGNLQKAVDFYKKALAVDFTNLVSRERLIALEPDILSKDELLLTMKERNIIDPAAQNFSDEDFKILSKIIIAEKNSGIEYLSQKYHGKIPNGLIVERDSNKVYVRKMLTLTGYNDLLVKISQDAKQTFINKGIAPAKMYQARDAAGNQIFNNKGILTEEGITAFSRMLKGEKAYFLPGEKLPSAQRELDARIRDLLAKNYYEITMQDFIYLMDATRCRDDILQKKFYAVIVDAGNGKKRYFVSTSDARNMRYAPSLLLNHLYLMVQDYHAEKKAADSGSAPVYSSAFGINGGIKGILCDKNGDLPKTE